MELLVAITLLSLLSVGILFAMRIGINSMDRANSRLMSNRRILGVDRILTEQLAGLMPVKADCRGMQSGSPQLVPFFQGEPQQLRFASSYSIQDAARGYPRMLEYAVIPGENGMGVRLVVNELLYSGPRSAGALCTGVFPDPGADGTPLPRFAPIRTGPASFVLADKLAYCRFVYKDELPGRPPVWVAIWRRRYAPKAIRIELAPLALDPARLQLLPITAAIRVDRDWEAPYMDQMEK